MKACVYFMQQKKYSSRKQACAVDISDAPRISLYAELDPTEIFNVVVEGRAYLSTAVDCTLLDGY